VILLDSRPAPASERSLPFAPLWSNPECCDGRVRLSTQRTQSDVLGQNIQTGGPMVPWAGSLWGLPLELPQIRICVAECPLCHKASIPSIRAVRVDGIANNQGMTFSRDGAGSTPLLRFEAARSFRNRCRSSPSAHMTHTQAPEGNPVSVREIRCQFVFSREIRCLAAHNAVGLAGESPAVGIDCLST
jgi:hypothetical protein